MKVSMLVQSLHPTIAVVKLDRKLFSLICYAVILICYAEILEKALYQLVTIRVLRHLWPLVCLQIVFAVRGSVCSDRKCRIV